jgi:hypothetical protein
MPSKESRKEAIRKFKERKPSVGTYAVRCVATGRAWVGTSRNLEATKNGGWFCLRSGSHQDKSLQQQWDVHGETAFQYEILDRVDEDVHPLELNDLLKLKRNDWAARLNAQQLL